MVKTNISKEIFNICKKTNNRDFISKLLISDDEFWQDDLIESLNSMYSKEELKNYLEIIKNN